MNNNAKREFLPLVIIAFLALLIAGIIARNLALILIFVSFLESSLLFYFMSNLNTNDIIRIGSKMIFLTKLTMITIAITIITAALLRETWTTILLTVIVILIAIQTIIVYRNR